MNKLLWILVIVVIIVGAVVLLSKNNKTQEPTAQTQPINQTQKNKRISETTVFLTKSGFEPQKVTIKAGTKVVWVNKSGSVGTVNSAQHPTHLVYPPLNLGQFADGSSVNLVFDKPGVYKYHNHLNPTQTGSITVE